MVYGVHWWMHFELLRLAEQQIFIEFVSNQNKHCVHFFQLVSNHHAVCLPINHPENLDNIFSPKALEKQYAQNKAVGKNIDE